MSSTSRRQDGPRKRKIVAITGRCSDSTIERLAASSPACAARTIASVRSVTGGRGRRRSRRDRWSVAGVPRILAAGAAPSRADPGLPSQPVGDQVGVVAGIAEPLVDQLAVDDDLLPVALAGLERQV